MTTLASWDPLADKAQDSKEPPIAPNPSATREQDTPVPEASLYQQKHLDMLTKTHLPNGKYFTGMQEESGKKTPRQPRQNLK